ncbi:cytochrome and DOMON domain-containing protein [Aspergillus thermomutatus]|uniref:Cytochrome b561 domain-containing protein n=1 Tax=Aspergillus thermomutatus TaxID=41047 RepID=A0A397GRB2_ASPTH|nr:uncharacterized protein CDV56_107491 [Aspergillus thermomutatus]RHZ53591.1 hypothetical protein CDV56_107491 [Aspergillus thermomutatus]
MKVHTWIGLTVALSLFTSAEAHPATFHPQGRDDISFTITVSDAAKSSQLDALFFQIQAPSTVQWVALGQGDQMAGAHIFLIYASSSTNVTVSPRAGTGHVLPRFNPESHISLLPGTGIRNATMTANFRCHDCLGGHGDTINATDSASRWIWAYKNGSPIESDDVSAAIDYHDAFGGVVVDLTRARSTIDMNGDPFSDASSDAVRPIDELSISEPAGLSATAIAHGCLMAIAFLLLFPTFALLVPLSTFIRMPVTTIHAPLQGLALATAITGLGLGLKMWADGGSNAAAHPIIGIVVVASLALVQPVLGWLQHKHFKRTGGKSWFAYLHRWLGRGMLALGTINGGLGFWWLGSSTGPLRTGMIVYAVVACVVFVAYVGVHVSIWAGSAGRQEDLQGVRLEDRPSAEMLQSLNLNDGTKASDDVPRAGGYEVGVAAERGYKD